MRGRGARQPPQPEGLQFLKRVENKDEIATQLKEFTSNTAMLMHFSPELSSPNDENQEKQIKTEQKESDFCSE